MNRHLTTVIMRARLNRSLTRRRDRCEMKTEKPSFIMCIGYLQAQAQSLTFSKSRL